MKKINLHNILEWEAKAKAKEIRDKLIEWVAGSLAYSFVIILAAGMIFEIAAFIYWIIGNKVLSFFVSFIISGSIFMLADSTRFSRQ